jgi:hypothetical protein
MLPGATNMDDVGMFQHGCDLGGRRLKHLRLIANPDGFDNVARNALIEAAGNGFYLRKFGHWELV